MRSLKKLLDFFLYSNLFISVCAAAATAQTYLQRFQEINWLYLSFVFFSTLVFYLLPSLYFTEKAFSANESERLKWIREHKNTLRIFLAAGIIGVTATVFFLPLKFILYLLPAALIAFAYFIPPTNLRRFIILKAVIIAFVWADVTCISPLLFHSFPEADFRYLFDDMNGLLIGQRFVFILPLCIVFNVRDMEADKAAGVRTFPLAFGINAAKISCVTLLFLFTAFLPFPFGKTEILLIASAIATALLILKTSTSSSEYFYSLWIDGMILLQAILTALVHYWMR